jgi:hypothetical protein
MATHYAGAPAWPAYLREVHVAKRRNPMPLIYSRDDTNLVVMLSDTGQQLSQLSVVKAESNQVQKNSAQKNRVQTKPVQKNHGRDRGSRNGHALSGNGMDPQNPVNATSQSSQQDRNVQEDVRTLIRDHRVDAANGLVMTLLDQRIAAGDTDLRAASLLLQHYEIMLSRIPPLSHVGAIPLRPNDYLYACFDQFIDLIRQQQNQISELQAIIAELI